MARTEIDTLLYVIDDTFDGGDEHALVANLRDVKEAEWRQPPPGGGTRTIADLVHHVTGSKFGYENHAFGDATFRYDRGRAPEMLGAGMEEMIAWLREGQERWRAAIASLTDDRLDEDFGLPWGARRPIRTTIAALIQHDAYHAGEINHLRALLQGTDRWPWD